MIGVLRTKPVEQSIRDSEEPGNQLRRSLGPVDLTVIGIGVIIGTGIFVLTGKAAGVQAGPAVAISFVIAGIVCALAALCYAELASTVPVAGSAYTFSYATLGELVAWIIGWDLILELALGASTVAVGWSTYLVDLMKTAGITVPDAVYGERHNLLAAGVVLLLTALICLGIKASARVTAVIVAIKLAIVLLVIVAGAFFVHTANWSPFVPPSGSQPAAGSTVTPSLLQDIGLGSGAFGWSGVLLPAVTWVRFGLWMVVGLLIYALYGARHSRLRGEGEPVDDSRSAVEVAGRRRVGAATQTARPAATTVTPGGR